MININSLWDSGKEDEWNSALSNYWNYVKPSHLAVEKEFDALNINSIKAMNPEEWYEFLLQKYFFWKYTSPNRYATTSVQLKKYQTSQHGLEELFFIKQRLFDFDKENIFLGLRIASSIRGLGTAGASGLLAVLFPECFATVDQFAVKSLLAVDRLPDKAAITYMKPEQLKIKDAVILMNIMKNKATELNKKFMTSFWTPRKIDMVLWSVHR